MFNSVTKEMFLEIVKIIGKMTLIAMFAGVLIGFSKIVNNLLYIQESVVCEVSSKYLAVEEGIFSDHTAYYVSLTSQNVSDNIKITQSIYDSIDIGDKAEAIAIYDSTDKEFLGFYDLKLAQQH